MSRSAEYDDVRGERAVDAVAAPDAGVVARGALHAGDHQFRLVYRTCGIVEKRPAVVRLRFFEAHPFTGSDELTARADDVALVDLFGQAVGAGPAEASAQEPVYVAEGRASFDAVRQTERHVFDLQTNVLRLAVPTARRDCAGRRVLWQDLDVVLRSRAGDGMPYSV